MDLTNNAELPVLTVDIKIYNRTKERVEELMNSVFQRFEKDVFKEKAKMQKFADWMFGIVLDQVLGMIDKRLQFTLTHAVSSKIIKKKEGKERVMDVMPSSKVRFDTSGDPDFFITATDGALDYSITSALMLPYMLASLFRKDKEAVRNFVLPIIRELDEVKKISSVEDHGEIDPKELRNEEFIKRLKEIVKSKKMERITKKTVYTAMGMKKSTFQDRLESCGINLVNGVFVYKVTQEPI